MTFERRSRRGTLGASTKTCFQMAELKPDPKTRKDISYKDGIEEKRFYCLGHFRL